MKKILKPAGVFIKAMPHFLVFELIFKLLLLAVGTPVTALLLKLTMKLSGVTYLNDENLFIYLKHPSTLIVIVLMLFFYAFFSFVELSALVACFSCYTKKQRIYLDARARHLAGLRLPRAHGLPHPRGQAQAHGVRLEQVHGLRGQVYAVRGVES